MAFAASTIAGCMERRQASLEVLRVQRIELVEPEGTLRMVVSNNARFPGGFSHGQEFAHERRKEDGTAGFIFLDAEGSESGGLIFGGSKHPDGTHSRFGHLSFDQYEQDQVISLTQEEEGTGRAVAIKFTDRPDWPITDEVELLRKLEQLPPEERDRVKTEFMATHPRPAQRIYLGRKEDRSSALELKDAQGRARLVLRVTAQGSPELQFLDENGVIVGQLPPPAPVPPAAR